MQVRLYNGDTESYAIPLKYTYYIHTYIGRMMQGLTEESLKVILIVGKIL